MKRRFHFIEFYKQEKRVKCRGTMFNHAQTEVYTLNNDMSLPVWEKFTLSVCQMQRQNF